MTTYHRPTLESKRGRDLSIKDTIQHARASRGQTSLKLRSDLSGAQIDHKQGKRALQELEYGSKRLKGTDSSDVIPPGTPAGQDYTPSIIDSELKMITSEVKTRQLGSQKFRNTKDSPEHVAKIQKGKEHKLPETRPVLDENSKWSGASESEDDDTEALMRELEKVKQERTGKQRKGAITFNNLLVAKDVSGKREKQVSAFLDFVLEIKDWKPVIYNRYIEFGRPQTVSFKVLSLAFVDNVDTDKATSSHSYG